MRCERNGLLVKVEPYKCKKCFKLLDNICTCRCFAMRSAGLRISLIMREAGTAKAQDIYSKAFAYTHSHDDQWDINASYFKLSQRIDEQIGDDLSKTVSLIEKYNAFQQREQYRCFLRAQLAIHAFVEPIYADPVIQSRLPWRTSANRVGQIRLDMSDLKMLHTDRFADSRCLPNGYINRLGWLYVAECWNRQDTRWLSLVKQLQLHALNGARHLGEESDHVNRWFMFTSMYDNLRISEVEEDRLFAGARSAMSFLSNRVSRAFNADLHWGDNPINPRKMQSM